MRTSFALTMPAASRWKWFDELISRAGMTPSSHGPLLAVDVGEERLEHPHALLDARFDGRPLGLFDHARHGVERERPLLAGEVEGDALGQVRAGERLGATPQLGLRHLREGGVDLAVRLARDVRLGEHLIPGRGALAHNGRGTVAVEQVAHAPSLVRACCDVVSTVPRRLCHPPGAMIAR